jgi:hypothetical protein
MKTAVALIVALLAAGSVAAQGVPRLDGTWKLDMPMSGIHRTDYPDITLTVSQSDSELVFETKAVGRSVLRYRLGEETTQVSGGLKRSALAKWAAGRLVVVGEREMASGMAPYMLTISLAGESDLVIDEHIHLPSGDALSKQVYHRIE